MTVKGYKAFDKEFKCRGFQYEVGKTYTIDDKITICENGFHFCENIIDVLYYYPITSRFAEVEASGGIIKKDNKSCTNNIKIIKELTREELLVLFNCKDNNLGKDNLGDRNTGNCNTGNCNTGNCNTGYRNTGDRNTGDRNTGNCNTGNCNTGYRNTGNCNTGYWNTGNCNTGYWNTGNCNTGDCNTGDWNTCNYETGFFNTVQNDTVRVFNKYVSRLVWDKYTKPNFIYNVHPNIWVYWSDMNDTEKKQNPNAYIQDGYLKHITMEEAWKNAFADVTDEDIKLLKALPNYDYGVFSEITGLKDNRLK